ncbi:hypothetical protein [Actinoplanes sp. NPDC023714]|uniref:hypothetical protein n=1 Tax=Actinoplanes sp. NPDC023714 TaxID=3154322 RepID=UPI0033CE8F20
MRHFVAALGAVLAGAVLGTAAGSPARADEPGFSVRVTAPGDFVTGEAAQTVTAVVTSENRRCRKVRWALLVRSGPAGDGLSGDQLRVVRVEEDGEFGTSTSAEGGTTTILDDRLDPGTLCRGRTVTGRWQVAFTGPDAGRVRFEARAFDAQGTLLTTAGATTRVESDTPPSPSPSPSPTREEQAPAEAEAEDETPAAQPARESGDPQAALVAEDSFLLGPGLIVGGVFVFLGVLLLLRIRARSRAARLEAQTLPTGFYRMPR